MLNGLQSRSSMHDKLSNEKETRGILNWDLTLPLNGKVWLYLINKHWSTDELNQTDEQGNIMLDAFHGTYQITIEHQGKIQKYQLQLEQAPTEVSYSI